MGKMGISKSFINFVGILYVDNSLIIINNGYLSQPVLLSRDLRQRFPVSLPLYVIQGEITVSNIYNKIP